MAKRLSPYESIVDQLLYNVLRVKNSKKILEMNMNFYTKNIVQ